MSDPILCVDPEQSAREATRQALQASGYAVEACASKRVARQAFDEGTYSCVVIEQDLPDGAGVTFVDHVRDIAPDTACILFTDVPLERIDTSRLSTGITEFLSKDDPVAHDRLVSIVETSIETRAQTAYPLLEDEPDRLAALERYTEAPRAASATLERLTRLATALFDVSMAAVGILDEREQRFLSCTGVSLDSVQRENTVCTHAVLEEDVTVIEDTQADPRFTDNEGLGELGIRFYASANISAADGHVLGTFCVYDAEPGTFDADDRKHLQLLADEAAEQLELRRRLHDREATEHTPPAGEDR